MSPIRCARPPEAGAAELRAITTRVDLLSSAAGMYMAEHRHDASLNPFARHAADLLFAAGADLDQAEVAAAEVLVILRRPMSQAGSVAPAPPADS